MSYIPLYRAANLNYTKDLHSQVSCLKGFFMAEIFECMKFARECCGAHGYSDFGNIANQIEIWAPNVTLEGDEYVLYQQTTKDIFKRLTKMFKGEQPVGAYSYLNDFLDFMQEPPKIKYTRSVDSLVEILKVSLLHQIMTTGNKLKAKDGKSFDEKWNKVYLMDVVKTARLNAIYMIATLFKDQIQALELSTGLYNTLERLLKIFCCKMILRFSENVILNENLDSKALFDIDNWMKDLIDESSPQLLDLVEPAIHNDKIVTSALSPTQGNPYDQLYQCAASSELNER